MEGRARQAAWAVAGASFLVLYWPVFVRLVRDWANDDNYSHGFLILPLALYFVWERRRRLSAAPVEPAMSGLLVLGFALTMLVTGLLGAELFLTRASIVIALAGSLAFLAGWRSLRILLFPLAFLLLMIPIPAIIFNQVAFPLQILASRVGEVALSACAIPVLREGNVIVLANTTLEVAEACSGIRSLVSLLTLGIVYGYFTDPRSLVRLGISLSAIPIAIITNAARVAGTGIAAHHLGAGAAEGFFHTFSGWLVFLSAFLLLFGVAQLLLRVVPPARADQSIDAAVA